MNPHSMPNFMKHFSVGATLGLCLGSFVAALLPTKWVYVLAVIYAITFAVGFNGVKHDFIKAVK